MQSLRNLKDSISVRSEFGERRTGLADGTEDGCRPNAGPAYKRTGNLREFDVELQANLVRDEKHAPLEARNAQDREVQMVKWPSLASLPANADPGLYRVLQQRLSLKWGPPLA